MTVLVCGGSKNWDLDLLPGRATRPYSFLLGPKFLGQDTGRLADRPTSSDSLCWQASVPRSAIVRGSSFCK